MDDVLVIKVLLDWLKRTNVFRGHCTRLEVLRIAPLSSYTSAGDHCGTYGNHAVSVSDDAGSSRRQGHDSSYIGSCTRSKRGVQIRTAEVHGEKSLCGHLEQLLPMLQYHASLQCLVLFKEVLQCFRGLRGVLRSKDILCLMQSRRRVTLQRI